MRGFVVLALLALVAGLVVTRAEPLGPHAAFDGLPAVIGATTPLTVRATDRGSGLAEVELRLTASGAEPLVLARQEFPRTGFLGSGVHEATLATTLGDLAVPEGPATLEAWATDHSWLSAFRSGPRAVAQVTVDRTPPQVQVLTTQLVARVGGSESLVFRTSDDTATAGVQVGDYWFPATPGLFADPQLRFTLFAVPHDAGDAKPQVVVADAAGNRRAVPVDIVIKPRTFAQKQLPITDEFLQQKVPDLLAANGLPNQGTLLEGYLRVNRELRRSTEVRLREMCSHSEPRRLWDGAFLRLPDSAPLSGFADQRTYLHDGEVIDKQTHLGFDLASLKRAVVPAGNAGVVVHAGPLGIYGDTVVLDHGLGLGSLYGHLSEISVKPGQAVKRGEAIGRTGDTGLAGGDHLHFSTMVDGIHVDPVEWWDAHWIQDHVLLRLDSAPRATAPVPPASVPAAGAPASAPTPTTTLPPAAAPAR